MMDHKLIIETKGGGVYMTEAILHQLQSEITAKSLEKSCTLSAVNQEVFFETNAAIPIIVPKFDTRSMDPEGDLEIIIKYFCKNPKEDNGETLRRYGTFIHYMLKGLQDYVDSKIVLNIDNANNDEVDCKEIRLIFGSDSDYVPKFYLMSMYEGERIAPLLRGFSFLS